MEIAKVCIIFFFLILSSLPVSAAGEAIVAKAALPYEISSISATISDLTFSGWAFLVDTQHFVNVSDHSYELEFASLQHTFRVDTTLTSLNLTELMRYSGAPLCANNVYFQKDTTCYSRYENVGFTATIPFAMFQTGMQYTVYLVVHANSANSHKKILIYYPIANDIVVMNGQKEFRIASKLNDTKLTVKYPQVIARKGPDKSSAQWYSGTNCSTTYGNQLFFLENSVYASIKERNMNLASKTTYYRVASVLSTCVGSRRRIVEGSTLTPVWIPSSFVEYSGTPLTVTTRIVNTAPVIKAGQITIRSGQAFNWRNYVSAFDAEEGDISDHIQLISDKFNNSTNPGIYVMVFRVQDMYGAGVFENLDITVIEAENNSPIIVANDFQVLLNSVFDYRSYASASDKEDGNLTSTLRTSTTANLSVPGSYAVCYEVNDSKFAFARRCVTMTVFDYASLISRFRFVDKDRLFAYETIPMNWIGYIQRLVGLMETTEVIASMTIDN
jgi:hypothetical protein